MLVKFQVMEGSESAVTVSISCMVVPAGTIVASRSRYMYVIPVDEKEKFLGTTKEREGGVE